MVRAETADDRLSSTLWAMIPVSLRYRHFNGMECAPTRVTRCQTLSLESKPTGLVFTNEAKSLRQPTYSESSKGERGLPYAHQPPSPAAVMRARPRSFKICAGGQDASQASSLKRAPKQTP